MRRITFPVGQANQNGSAMAHQDPVHRRGDNPNLAAILTGPNTNSRRSRGIVVHRA